MTGISSTLLKVITWYYNSRKTDSLTFYFLACSISYLHKLCKFFNKKLTLYILFSWFTCPECHGLLACELASSAAGGLVGLVQKLYGLVISILQNKSFVNFRSKIVEIISSNHDHDCTSALQHFSKAIYWTCGLGYYSNHDLDWKSAWQHFLKAI